MQRPLIGITADIESDKLTLRPSYAEAVAQAGGLPVILPHEVEHIGEYVERCDGFVLTGGDDPSMEPFGESTHPNATRIAETRQAFEVQLLKRLSIPANAESPPVRDHPVLAICLGMQLMALAAGGKLDQHLPDSCPTHEDHWGKKTHRIEGPLGTGEVLSHHRQAIVDPGTLEVVARAHDGMIEAVRDPNRRFCVGVQWHPERTADQVLGMGLFRDLILACAEIQS